MVKQRWFINTLCLLASLLTGCAKPPDLDAPCREFGKYCAQQPINEAINVGKG